jgi:hypothetical protein
LGGGAERLVFPGAFHAPAVVFGHLINHYEIADDSGAHPRCCTMASENFCPMPNQQPRRHCAMRRIPRGRSLTLSALLLAAVGAASFAGAVALAKSKPVSWKAIEDALLRVNNVAVKDWSVYQTGKKRDPLLLQMGNRFLLIAVHDRQVFEVDPSKVEQKPEELLWDPSDRPAHPLATSDWTAVDIGAAFRINAKIDVENRVLDLELPHPPDVGDLPVQPTGPQRRR